MLHRRYEPNVRVASRWAIWIVVAGGCESTASADQASAQRGATIFAAACARCHGAEGYGGQVQAGGQVSRNLRDSAFLRARTDEELAATITAGKPPAMPAFEGVLAPDEIASVIAHLRFSGS